MSAAFETPIEDDGTELAGPWRQPRQMLGDQSYEGHSSIHDDATAQTLGFRGGTIEGPTHFSQFDPLCVALWGERWFAEGCISAHYRNPVFEGEEVRAIMRRVADRPTQATITMVKRDGTEVLAGTVSIGPVHPATALETRLAGLPRLADPVILADIAVGMATSRIPVTMAMTQHMGALYPFSLADKLALITEPSPRYAEIVPFEMVSVLLNHAARAEPFPTRGPSVGLFADQEIRMIAGPVRIGAPYEIEREVVALSGSRRTESMWVRTRLFRPGEERPVAEMLLNTASLKASYAHYDRDYAALHGETGSMPDFNTLSYELRDGIAVATFSRPERMNTFGIAMMQDLLDLIDHVDADDAVRALVLTGSGRAFCAGADLGQGGETFDYKLGGRTGDIDVDGVRRDGGGRVTLRMFRCLKPIIAAVNGAAVGIGATMLLPMDARLAASDARFGFVFARRGITPEACSGWFLPRLVGVPTALDWLYSGRIFGAEEARTHGLVQAIHAPEDLLDAAIAHARALTAQSAPVSIALARQMVWQGLAAPHPMDMHRVDSRALQARGRSADAREGITAFLEKREARFPDAVSSDMPDFFPWSEEPPFV